MKYEPVSKLSAAIANEVGLTVMDALHKQNYVYDFVALLGMLSLITLNVYLVNLLQDRSVLLLLLSSLQALFFTQLGILNHDLFVHRNVIGRKYSWIASIFLSLPIMIRSVNYTYTHLNHHRYVGTEQDSEDYKQDLDTRFKKVLFCTIVGVVLATNRSLTTKASTRYFDISGANADVQKRAKVESYVKMAFIIAIASCVWLFPMVTLFALIIPSFIFVPVLNTLRIVIEHAETNEAENPIHMATYYKTGWFTRVAFLWDAGDCHLIHHLFPRIPFYRMSSAINVIDPILISRGVVRRDSYVKILKGWFIYNYPHRTLWFT